MKLQRLIRLILVGFTFTVVAAMRLVGLRRAVTLLVPAVLLILFGAHPASADMIGISFAGEVFEINSSTGSGVSIGPSGFGGTNSLAEHAGVFYSAPLGVPPRPLISINPVSGAGTPLVNFSAVLEVRGMAVAPNGTMFVINNGGSTTIVDELWSVNIGTGASTFVGTMGLPNFQGLSFEPGGTLFAWSIFQGLHTVNVATGLATDVNTGFNNGGFDIKAIDFAGDGTLFGARDELYTIDSTTGIPTLIGSGGYSNLRGIAVIPEPSTALLLASGIAALAVGRGRRAL